MEAAFHIWNIDNPPSAGTKPSVAVLQALAMLESFEQNRPKQSLADISRRLNIPKASALRHLSALEQAGYVARHSDNLYSLTARVLQLSRAYECHNELLPSARPVLNDLAAETGETAHLGVLHGTHVIYLAIAESPQRVRACVAQGDRVPAHCVASGKAILAYAPPFAMKGVIDEGLPQMSANTIVSADDLEADLVATRTRGYGLNIGEWSDEVIAASAPVFAHTGDVVGAIGISGPTGRLDPERINSIGKIVRKHADHLSVLLGASNPHTR